MKNDFWSQWKIVVVAEEWKYFFAEKWKEELTDDWRKSPGRQTENRRTEDLRRVLVRQTEENSTGQTERKTCRQQQKEEQGILERERKTREWLASYRWKFRGPGVEQEARGKTNGERDKWEPGTPIWAGGNERGRSDARGTGGSSVNSAKTDEFEWYWVSTGKRRHGVERILVFGKRCAARMKVKLT